jgi:hypothetical protein
VLPSGAPDFRIPEAFAPQAARPPCYSLRGQPCRIYQPAANLAP